MRIERALVEAIAAAGLPPRFRQIDPLTTKDFTRWLATRGIEVGGWPVLHRLWEVGVLHPVAVVNRTRLGRELGRVGKLTGGVPSGAWRGRN